MRVLVTGSNGFIGRHVMESFREHQPEVTIAGLDKSYRDNKPGQYAEDLLNKQVLEQIVKDFKPDVVVHLAAMASVFGGMTNPNWYLRNNIEGTGNLLLAGVGIVKKWIFAASGGTVYGTVEKGCLPVSSLAKTHPNDIYGLTKLTGEHLVRIYAQQQPDVSWYNLRFPNVYGPGQNPYGEAGVVAIFTNRMLRGESCYITGDGEQTRDYAYVDDVANWVRWFVAGSIPDAMTSGDYNVGTGIETSVNTIYNKLAGLIGCGLWPLYTPAKSGEVRYISLKPDVLCPTYLDDGLRLTVSSFREALDG